MATKRLIDANVLIETIKFEHDRIMQDPEIGNNMKWCEAVCNHRATEAIERSPTVDAVEVPCKIGDSVWGIKIYNHGREAKKGVVHNMYFGEDMRLCICVKNVCRGEWGKNVFATKEEAEAALAKMDGDGNV